MNLEKHISNLLYRYDCVIVPEFGGFLTQKTSAQFNPVSYEFLPPMKELRFNSSLKNNDGLLVNYISQVENSSFEEVSNLIQNIVKNWKADLVEGKKLILKNIGTFNLNEEGSLVFAPSEEINYAKDSFGLTPVKAHYILREEEKLDVATPFSFKKASMIAAGVALLACIGTLGYTQKDQVKYQMANIFNPPSIEESRDLSHFASHDPALYPQPYVMKAITAEELAAIESKEVEKVVVKLSTIKEVEKTETKNTIVTRKVGKYQLIGGAFKNSVNAKKKLKQLKTEGYQNAQILGVLSGMTIVSYDTYHNQREAQKAVNRLKNQGKEVWLRIKK
ncbi:hypothetical protein UJ101_01193 [Flavobacteriaceae bacterium UJ101]|nr:hypothetical protein UJ101_01193 [Flavobacteriaceae bacterium UJ101]